MIIINTNIDFYFQTNPPGLEDEDEDLDVLELRLAALASYAKSTR